MHYFVDVTIDNVHKQLSLNIPKSVGRESQHYTTSTVQQLTLFCIIQDLKCTRSQLGTWHQQKELAGG